MRLRQQAMVLIISLCCVLGGAWAKPGNPLVEEHIQAAKDYMEHQQWDFAGYEWRNALNLEPGNVTAHIGLANALLKGGFPQDALAHLEKAAKSFNNLTITLALADMYRDTGKLQEAATVYAKVLAKAPFQQHAYTQLQKLGPKLPGKYQSLLKSLLDKRANEAHHKALALMQKGGFKDAIPYYQMATSRFPKKYAWRNDYALALLLSGKRNEALNEFEAVRRKGQLYCHRRANAALVVLSQGRTSKALKVMQQALANCSDNSIYAMLYNNLGYIYEMGRNIERARFAYERAIQLNPDLTKAYKNLGYVYQRLQDYKRAIVLYRRLLERQPGNAEFWNQLGFVYELDNDFKAARKAYEKAIALQPDFKPAYVNLKLLYRKLDESEKVDDVAQKLAHLEFSSFEQPEPVHKTANQYQKPALFEVVDLFFEEVKLQ